MTGPVVVLGAGMVGTCTAIHLALRGRPDTLVDRREPGRETSYGNSGVIQAEAMEPAPFPRDAATLLRVALRRGADVHYHLGAMPRLAGVLMRYRAASHPARHARITASYATLIARATDEHAPLIELAGAQALVRRDGFRFVHRDESTLQAGVARARRLSAAYGLRHVVQDARALAAAEPALHGSPAGAIHWLDPWTVSDPGGLVARYAAALAGRGGRIVRGDAMTLHRYGAGWRVRTDDGDVDAEHAVIALGPWSDTLLRTLDYRYPLFVKRGYHRHYRADSAPQLPLYDADRGLVICPMRQGVRVTTGAEFARLDAPPTPVQMGRAEALARQLIRLGDPIDAEPWLGARPCTADMLPVIGPAPRHPNLWMNLGHAHQGFTLGPVSGRLLAEMIVGGPTVVDPVPFAPARFDATR